MKSVGKTLPGRFRDTIDDWRYRKIYRRYQRFTMLDEGSYLANLRLAALAAKIPGSVVECGTWRGGMIAGIADVLGGDRQYYLFDSFEGLPQAKPIDGHRAVAWQSNRKGPTYYNNCTAGVDEASTAMSMSSAKEFRIIKGWFDETLPAMTISEPIAILRMDADWYDSTKCVLDNCASRLAPGSLIIVDDYYSWDGCTRALNEFAVARNWRIRQFEGTVCFIII